MQGQAPNQTESIARYWGRLLSMKAGDSGGGSGWSPVQQGDSPESFTAQLVQAFRTPYEFAKTADASCPPGDSTYLQTTFYMADDGHRHRASCGLAALENARYRRLRMQPGFRTRIGVSGPDGQIGKVAAYMLKAGDSPEDIAEKFTKSRDRWVELLRVNPHIAQCVNQQGYATFCEDAWVEGQSINTPSSWTGEYVMEGGYMNGPVRRSGAGWVGFDDGGKTPDKDPGKDPGTSTNTGTSSSGSGESSSYTIPVVLGVVAVAGIGWMVWRNR